MNPIWTSIIGVVGVIVGVLLNEIIRRSRRIETFTPAIFEKRLAKYEKLMGLIQAGYDVASAVMENEDFSQEERHALISKVILNIAEFADKEELYIDAELGAHCVATFMGAEDVMSIGNPREREERKQIIRDMYNEAKRMIREDSGICEIDKLFKKLHKPELTGPVIDRIKDLKKHPEKIEAIRERAKNV
jgi:hypothetical protein